MRAYYTHAGPMYGTILVRPRETRRPHSRSTFNRLGPEHAAFSNESIVDRDAFDHCWRMREGRGRGEEEEAHLGGEGGT